MRISPPCCIVALLALSCSPAVAQSFNSPSPDTKITAAAPAVHAFELADIHSSPFTNQPFMRGGDLHGSRYSVHQATMVDLISNAYSVEHDSVLRGPSWLDIDRYDIVAKAPPTTSKDDVKVMLRALLADRFSLAVHDGTKPMPAFLLTVNKGGPKFKPSDGTGDPGCQYKPPPPDRPAGSPPPYIEFSCHNVTMKELADDLHNWAGGYLTNPVVDQTGLNGGYDFDLKWSGRGDANRAGSDAITIFDCVEKLGLKLEAKTAPLPVIFVDSASEKPTPNAPGLDKALPPPPPGEFDVAILKPSKPGTRLMGQVTGDQVTLQGGSVQWLITWAWDISDDMIADPPKWLNQDKFDLLAKMAHDSAADGPQSGPRRESDMDYDQLQQMVKNLLADRFGLKVHMEDRPADAYTLVAANPKMKKADPDNRTGCHEGPGPDGKDPRIANPILGRLLTCQNMTMAQLGDQLRIQASGYIHAPVLDATGLKDTYDFTLSFSTAGQVRNQPPPPKEGDSSGPTASDPSLTGLSLFDALEKQLGVKLVKQKRPVPMLVIDHINETPVED